MSIQSVCVDRYFVISGSWDQVGSVLAYAKFSQKKKARELYAHAARKPRARCDALVALIGHKSVAVLVVSA